jgi:hypothetical protein
LVLNSIRLKSRKLSRYVIPKAFRLDIPRLLITKCNATDTTPENINAPKPKPMRLLPRLPSLEYGNFPETLPFCPLIVYRKFLPLYSPRRRYIGNRAYL